MDDFINRLLEYMKKEGLRPVDLGEKLDISKSTVSRVIRGLSAPSVDFLEKLSNISGKSINWWLHGVDEYRSLESLNTLIDTFIEKGFIKPNEPIEKVYEDMLYTMLEKEIEVKLEKYKKRGLDY